MDRPEEGEDEIAASEDDQVAAEPAPLPSDPDPVVSEPEPEPTVPAAVTAVSHWVQLASFSQKSAANTAWSRIQQQHSVLLRTLGFDIQRAELDDGRIFYRLRTGPLSDRASATALCRSLKAAGQDCLVVSP